MFCTKYNVQFLFVIGFFYAELISWLLRNRIYTMLSIQHVIKRLISELIN